MDLSRDGFILLLTENDKLLANEIKARTVMKLCMHAVSCQIWKIKFCMLIKNRPGQNCDSMSDVFRVRVVLLCTVDL